MGLLDHPGQLTHLEGTLPAPGSANPATNTACARCSPRELLPPGRTKVVPADPAGSSVASLPAPGFQVIFKRIGGDRSLAPFRSLISAGTNSCREHMAARRRPYLGECWGLKAVMVIAVKYEIIV